MSSGYLRKLIAAATALAALTAFAPPTAGATTTPAPGYEQFAGCPHPGENPSIVTCYRADFDGGLLQMGNMEIPITEPITLSGGMTATGEFSFGPLGGLSEAKQSVPGGVAGFTGITFLEGPLYAVIELAGNPSDPLAEPLSLPIKIHMHNPALGSKCYIGSNANPISLELITGTTSPPGPNEPIAGVPGSSSLTTPSNITDIAEATFVDNSFAAPGANGCVLTLFGYLPISINGAINATSNLPSPAGSNTAILEFDAEHVSSALVYP